MTETDQKKHRIRSLEKLASEVLKLKQERELRRPILIEFCGSPKSGKSTTITALNIFLKRNGFRTVVLTERASVCPINNKTHPFFNIWTMCSAMAETVKNLDSGKDKVDIIIADRGIFDALCWFTWLNTNPNKSHPYLDDENYKNLRDFILMNLWQDYLNFVYVMKVRPETSISREYANLLTEKRGSIMEESVLSSFNESIDLVTKKYDKHFKKIQKIETDTTDMDNKPNQVGYEVTSTTLNVLKEFLEEKIGYFDPDLRERLKSGINSTSVISNLKIRYNNRDKVEPTNNIQPIPIAVLTNPKRDKVLVVKKSSRRTSAISPENDKLLLYIGGHVRDEDESKDSFKTIEKALHREIQEEIGESISIKDGEPFLIYSPNNPKSERHIAICYVLEMNLENKKFKLTSDEFIMKTGTTKSGHIIDVKDVFNNDNKIEMWSYHIMNKVFNISPPKTADLFNDL